MELRDLPHLNASLNALSAVFLLLGFWCIVRKKNELHKKFMLSAVVSSSLFLVGYLTYHFGVAGVTKFERPESVRPFYIALLLSHTILAVTVPPLAVMTLVRAFRERWDRHRKIARWTLPIWLYVSVTGVLVYLMLYHFYPQEPLA